MIITITLNEIKGFIYKNKLITIFYFCSKKNTFEPISLQYEYVY